VSPLARGPLNVNADEAAAALAVGIGAKRLHFLSDVPGVYRGGDVVQALDATTVESLVENGEFEGGIVPKLLAAVRAARSGVAAEIGMTEVLA
jgi:acetylglutamate kinase